VNRTTSMGLMAFSIVLVVVGAILAFAVSVTTEGFSINTIGLILLLTGIVTFLVSLVLTLMGSGRRSTMREDVRSVPGGQSRTIEQQDNFAADA